jgi:hypothetical protein
MTNSKSKAIARRKNAEPLRTQAKPVPAKTAEARNPNHSRQPSKLELIRSLLAHPDGATLDELVSATGWLPHSVRAGMTGLRKQGLTITRTKADGATRFAIEAQSTETAA